MTTPPIQGLLDALNVAELPAQEQEELILELQETVFEGTMARLVEQMDDATAEEFSALVEKESSEEEVEAFLQERVPGANAVVEEVIKDLTDDILSVNTQ